MRYDKQNRKLDKIQRELEECIRLRKKAELEGSRLYSILDGIMHETRRLNAEIASACEELSRNVAKGALEEVRDDAESIFYTSGLISSRLTFADFEINPESIRRQSKLRSGIYRKFDKARRVLSKAARKKRLEIRLEGNSFNEIDAVPAFELVPFVLLDNAIKYSPENQEITVSFEDQPTQNTRTLVTVKSMGPVVSPDELHQILERGKRGSNAIRSRIPGEGIGLYLADTLAKISNCRMRISSSGDCRYSVGGIGYSVFTVTLEFR